MERIESLIKGSQTHVVNEVLTNLGIDARDRVKTQKFFHNLQRLSEQLEDGQVLDDLRWVHRFRTNWSSGTMRLLVFIGTMFVGGLGTVLVLGIKSYLMGTP